jgi:hypothetical protein
MRYSDLTFFAPWPAVDQHALHDSRWRLLIAQHAQAGVQPERDCDVDGQVNVCGGEAIGSLFHEPIMAGRVPDSVA